MGLPDGVELSRILRGEKKVEAREKRLGFELVKGKNAGLKSATLISGFNPVSQVLW